MAEGVVEVTVLRTSDASSATISISPTQTLNELKDGISRSTLGPIGRSGQRLFHLGRELKSGGRSLAKLGVGRFHNFIVHLHYSRQQQQQQQPVAVLEPPKRQFTTMTTPSQVIDLQSSDDDDDDEAVAVVENPARKRRCPRNRFRPAGT
mmetsp:Transcript_29203/g.67709  ORF Transcript_29203/g.67709 Transcript_29203/m.67709 type:complete len:150 (+) Transcript_29203:184-633(+)